MSYLHNIDTLLGSEAENLLAYECRLIPWSSLNPAGRDFVERVFLHCNRYGC
jgi:hypothetical protein